MNRHILILIGAAFLGILAILCYLYFIESSKNSTASSNYTYNQSIANLNNITTEDWRALVMEKLCKAWGYKVQYIENVPVCYNPKENTYVAYSLALEAAVKYCLKNGCPCDSRMLSYGLPEILKGNSNVCVIFFWGKGCPHCAREKPMLEELHKRYNITVFMYEVYYNPTNQQAFANACKIRNMKCSGVPTTFIGNFTFVGVLGDDELAYFKTLVK